MYIYICICIHIYIHIYVPLVNSGTEQIVGGEGREGGGVGEVAPHIQGEFAEENQEEGGEGARFL